VKSADTRFFRVNVQWHETGDVEHPYQATVGRQTWVIRLNDFPEEPLYTLIVDGKDVIDFDNWPPRWLR
jgi:hypothetical protein